MLHFLILKYSSIFVIYFKEGCLSVLNQRPLWMNLSLQIMLKTLNINLGKEFLYCKYTIWSKVSGHLTIIPFWACWTSQSNTMSINMELDPPLLLKQAWLQGFPQDFGVCLWEFGPVICAQAIIPLHQSLQLALCILISSVLLASKKFRFVHQPVISPLLQSTVVACFTPLQLTLGIAHGVVRLACSCSAKGPGNTDKN